MKAISIYIVILCFIAKPVTAQRVYVEANYNQVDYGPYYFYLQRAVSEYKKKHKDLESGIKDTLGLFITDSINFHREYSYIHSQYPHTCQNRCGKVGFINTEGQVIIPFEYDYIDGHYDSSFMMARLNNRHGVIDGKGHMVVPFNYSEVVQILPTTPPLFCLKNTAGKLGVLDNRLKPVIPFEYEAFNFIDSNILAFRRTENDSLISFYSKKGVPLFSLKGYSAKERAGKYIYITSGYGNYNSLATKQGKWIIPPGTYKDIAWIWDDLICVPQKDMFGIIDTKGKTILPFEYERISPTTNKQFIVQKNGRTAVVDLHNKLIIPFDSSYIFNFGVLYLVYRHNSTVMKLVNNRGERILSEKYSISGGGIPANSGKEGIESIDPMSTILVRDMSSRLLGLFRADGVQVLPVSYYYINNQPGYHAILVAKRSEADTNRLLYAAVDINGKFIAPFSDNELSLLSNAPGIYVSKDKDRKVAIVNALNGEAITPFEFEAGYVNNLGNGYISAKKGWFYALVSPDGKKLTEAVYSEMSAPTPKNRRWFDEEIVCVAKRYQQYIGLTSTGKELLKMR